jgi:preprotein translocase subunit YajC
MTNFLSNALILLSEVATDGAEVVEELTPAQQFMSALTTILPIALIALAFYFFLIRPQKKQEKETQKMRASIEIGDTITTIGGITGVVRQIKDDDIFIIETGADKNRISIKKWAIQSKDTISG